jgi:hypothetical protein
MRRHSSPPPAQLALDLRRETGELPLPQVSTTILQALADLLLQALGEVVEAEDQAEGGDDESEDHR